MDTGIGSFAPASQPIRVVAAQPTPERLPERANDPEPAAFAAPTPSERRVDIDAATNSLIFRTVDIATGVTVQQTPDEARLRLRAYIDTLGAKVAEPTLVATA
ncbi:hypothetical protein [Methylopila turkensis]|uniref:Flagellar protein FlaG n=1 Tax=Methylopila turkensis TaxID=1437816 RepID=A0A9W6N5V8_9HYPH|nr:hypothetical protein [Methylopila turkensis]GLK78793.1 hypothetical protein GCM10008174_05340 [Methylopila turkensis]